MRLSLSVYVHYSSCNPLLCLTPASAGIQPQPRQRPPLKHLHSNSEEIQDDFDWDSLVWSSPSENAYHWKDQDPGKQSDRHRLLPHMSCRSCNSNVVMFYSYSIMYDWRLFVWWYHKKCWDVWVSRSLIGFSARILAGQNLISCAVSLWSREVHKGFFRQPWGEYLLLCINK